MKYNIAENGYVLATITGSLTSAQVASLLAKTLSLTMDGDDVLTLNCDLGYRTDIYQARYYFSSATASGTVANSVSFYYMNDTVDGYSLSPTSVGPNYYYTTISGLGAPRYVKVVHTISGTAISGTLTGFEILNDDDIVDFGTDGTKTSESFSMSLNSSAVTSTIPIYNSGSANATAYVSIDPQYDDSDDILSIAETTAGTWYGVNLNNVLLANDEDTWNKGNYSNTEISSDILQLSSGQTTGTYTSCIFYNDGVLSYPILKLYEDDDVNLVSMEVRSSDTEPLPHHVYRKLGVNIYVSTWVRALRIEGYYASDGSSYHNYDNFITYSSDYQNAEKRSMLVTNNLDYKNRTFVLLYFNGTAYQRAFMSFCYVDDDGTKEELVIAKHVSTGWYITASFSSSFYDIKPDGNSGVWVHLYASISEANAEDGYFVDGPGYYLGYFDSDMQNIIKIQQTSAFVGGCDVLYSSGELWYTNTAEQQVIKLSTSGSVLIQFAEVGYINDLGDIVATSDGGCWFVNGNDLVKLNQYGELETHLEDVGTNLTCLALDSEDSALWIIDGEYVKRIFSDGRVHFSVYSSKTPTNLYPVDSGVWFDGYSDYSARFIGRDAQAELYGPHDRRQESQNNNYHRISFIEHSYDSTNHTSNFPTADDSYWSTLNWKSVDYRNYILPSDKYVQLRLTLTKEGSNSPKVERLSVQNSLEVQNISPGAYKNVYLKASIPDSSDTTYAGNYNTNLRVRWGIPI
jgi:hypothetical protein